MTSFLVWVCCQYSYCQRVTVSLHVVLFKLASILEGWGPWVGSNLEMWSCPTGYRPSYFVLEGGERSGEEHQGVTSSPALSLHPPARLLRIGGVCALRAVFLTFHQCTVSAQAHPNSAFLHTCCSFDDGWWWKFYPASCLGWYPLLLNSVSNLSNCGFKWGYSQVPWNGPSGVRQTAHNLYSTTCVRCWVRKTEASAATAMTSLFQSCGGF